MVDLSTSFLYHGRLMLRIRDQETSSRIYRDGRIAHRTSARSRGIARRRSGPAHDFLHVSRVAATARRIGAIEGANLDIVVPAAWLHELFNYPKGHAESHRSGDVCAEHAAPILRQAECPTNLIGPICECISNHAFSKGIVPGTIEGRVLQDADRLDAIGAIGIAACFTTCAEMATPFYAPIDPFCESREPDDKRWGLDHFYRKLLRIAGGLHTTAAREMASDRVQSWRTFWIPQS